MQLYKKEIRSNSVLTNQKNNMYWELLILSDQLSDFSSDKKDREYVRLIFLFLFDHKVQQIEHKSLKFSRKLVEPVQNLLGTNNFQLISN